MFDKQVLCNTNTVRNAGGRWNSSRALNSGVPRPKPVAVLLLALVLSMALPCLAAPKAKKDTGAVAQAEQSANSYLVKVSRFSVTGGDKPGDTATLNMTIETSGSGAKDIPWSFSNGSEVIASGIEHSVGAGKSIDVSATYRLPSTEGVVRLQGSIDPKNTLVESDAERANNVSKVVEKTLNNPVQASAATASTSKRNTAAISAASSSHASPDTSSALPLPEPVNATRSSGVSAVGNASVKKDSAAYAQPQPTSVNANTLAGIATLGNSVAATSGTVGPARLDPGKSVSVATTMPTGPLSTSGIKAVSGPGTSGTVGPARLDPGKSVSVATAMPNGPLSTSGIKAALGPGTDSVKADIKQNVVTSLSLDANVFRGSSVQGTITLQSPARVMGLTVNLSSSSPAIGVPASVTVAPGSTSASFTAVAPAQGEPGSVTVSAVVPGPGAVAKQATIAVWGVEQVQSLSLGACRVTSSGTTGAAPSSVNQMRNPRQGDTCRVISSLETGNPGLVRVNLSSTNASLSVPTNFTFSPSGRVAPSEFTFVVPQNATPGPVTFTATADRPGGIAKQLTVTIEAAAARQVSGLLIPLAETEPGGVLAGEVRLDGVAAAGGINVTLTSSSSSVSVPVSLTIPAGASSAAFSARVAANAAEGNVILSATRTGAGNPFVSQTRRIRNVQVKYFGFGAAGALQQQPLFVWQQNQVHVELDGVPISDVTLNLSSSNASIQVPTNITIPAGQTGGNFIATVSPAQSAGTVTLTAVRSGAAGNRTAQGLFQIVPAGSLHLADTSLDFVRQSSDYQRADVQYSKLSTQATIVLAAPAPPGGVRMNITADHAADEGLSMPASVVVPAGQTSAAFTVTLSDWRPSSRPSGTYSSVTIRAASTDGYSASANLGISWH
jgi:hypothetical protein